MSTTITADIDVDVPVRTAYDQWTQFESFPEFLSGVDDVTQVDDTLTHWVVSLGGVRREFDARIVDQVPDGHVAWRSVGEVKHDGRVAFRPESASRTRVQLTMEWEPEGLAEKTGAALQLDDMLVKHDLQPFKEFIEKRDVPPVPASARRYPAAMWGSTRDAFRSPIPTARWVPIPTCGRELRRISMGVSSPLNAAHRDATVTSRRKV